MKAMLLAAGRGSRLRPLTDTVPKALLSVGSHRLIEYHLLALKAIGIHDIVINVCHHAEKIMDYLGDGSGYHLRIQYSHESDNILGTGGGIYRALPLLGEEPFLVVSADIWSQFIWGASILEANSEAHLVFVDNPSFHPEGDYGLSEDGRVSLLGHKLTYAGMAKLHPRLFADARGGIFSLSQIFHAAIQKNKVSGEHYQGCWFNIGTLEELNRLRRMLQVGD
ncbi:MAG: mannose-1-phosphate guanylyltransferase [Coxiella sp. RIFCSPHIGHO2_12_FULL_44_14]|nr:MAG: mannose-1-phosphate guanylyltransferase [Coxiella sp. RIFCSPHIGHO2_12_FULL_44_14]